MPRRQEHAHETFLHILTESGSGPAIWRPPSDPTPRGLSFSAVFRWPGTESFQSQAKRRAPYDMGCDHHCIAGSRLPGGRWHKPQSGDPPEIAAGPHGQPVPNAGGSGVLPAQGRRCQRKQGACNSAKGEMRRECRERVRHRTRPGKSIMPEGPLGNQARRQRISLVDRQSLVAGEHEHGHRNRGDQSSQSASNEWLRVGNTAHLYLRAVRAGLRSPRSPCPD
jgi:hypothetical protein